MAKSGDDRAEFVIRLKLTTSLSDKQLCEEFKISAYRLKKWHKTLAHSVSISDKDLVYGALRSSGKSDIKDIIEFIDYKNHTRFSEDEVKGHLHTLIEEGIVVKEDGGFNFI